VRVSVVLCVAGCVNECELVINSVCSSWQNAQQEREIN